MDTVYPTMNKRRLAAYAGVTVLVVAAFWVGGYAYFTNSDSWDAAKQVISDSGTVTSRVGKVNKVSPSIFGFYYRYSGDSEEARLVVTVEGDKAQARFRAQLEKVRGTWVLVRISESL